MGCRKDKGDEKPKDAKYECSRCGAVAKKKKSVCKPKKVKKDAS